MAKKTARGPAQDAVVARLDRIIELLENVMMLQAKRYGLSKDKVRAIAGLKSDRVSRVTQNVTVPE